LTGSGTIPGSNGFTVTITFAFSKVRGSSTIGNLVFGLKIFGTGGV